MIQNKAIRDNALQYNRPQDKPMQANTIQHNIYKTWPDKAIQDSTRQCMTELYKTRQDNTTQYNARQDNAIHYKSI